MSSRNECPCCGSDNYEFHYCASEPQTAYCSNCGFYYKEHVKYPESEQVARYKQSDTWKKFIKLQEGK